MVSMCVYPPVMALLAELRSESMSPAGTCQQGLARGDLLVGTQGEERIKVLDCVCSTPGRPFATSPRSTLATHPDGLPGPAKSAGLML